MAEAASVSQAVVEKVLLDVVLTFQDLRPYVTQPVR